MKHSESLYDVIVVGGGHAGCEAAHVVHRMGGKVALITHSVRKIGEMSCNPAMGGIGKGHLIREIDALDGLMGRAADYAGIQFRLLNRSRGPAVQGPRAQIDRDLYKQYIQAEMQSAENITCIEAEVSSLKIRNERVEGIILSSGEEVLSGAVIITAGTFLKGVMFTGPQKTIGGRVGDVAADELAQQLRSLDVKIGRLKTGTPARLRGNSIAWDKTVEQPGDSNPVGFSLLSSKVHNHVSCFVTSTNSDVHDIVRDNITDSAVYGDYVSGIGPRYCPSIEDKIVRFTDKKSHNIFLEPETRNSELVYPNGISTSLPVHVQESFIRKIKGLEHAEIVRPGYAVEYDYLDPVQLHPTLEAKFCKGLFFAGQVIGTTGYEEAGALGLMAGVNSLLARDIEVRAFTFARDQAYIGVMIDDLVQLGVNEPYRMFTSRAEHRLTLRCDNADDRLTPIGIELGMVSAAREAAYQHFKASVSELESYLSRTKYSPDVILQEKYSQMSIPNGATLYDLCHGIDTSQSAVMRDMLSSKPGLEHAFRYIQSKKTYAGFLERQTREHTDFGYYLDATIPSNYNYGSIHGLSAEAVDKLTSTQPSTPRMAMSIEGVTRSAVMLLTAHLKREKSA